MKFINIKFYCVFFLFLLLGSCGTDSAPDSPLGTVTEDFTQAQPDMISEYTTRFGGSGWDNLNSVVKTSDGYILAGNTTSDDGDFQGIRVDVRYEGADAFLMKLNSKKEIQWIKTYGGDQEDSFDHIWMTDEGFTVIGSSSSDEGIFSDYEVFKADIDANGEIRYVEPFIVDISEKYDRSSISNIYRLDSGEVVASIRDHYDPDIRLFRYDSALNPISSVSFGGSNDDLIIDIFPNNNGMFIVGNTSSVDGDFGGLHDDLRSGYNAFIAKMNNSGSLDWLKSYGGLEDDALQAVTRAQNGDLLIAGINQTNDGDFEGKGGSFQRHINQIYLIRVNSDGDTIWKNTYGGKSSDPKIFSMIESQGQIILSGYTDSEIFLEYSGFEGDLNMARGGFFFFAFFDGDGSLLDVYIYSRDISLYDVPFITVTEDNHLIMVGDAISSHDPGILLFSFDIL